MAKEKILVVDDERSLRESIRMTLKSDYDVFIADNGKDALKIVEKQRPDLVLLDIVLPGMDGMEILKKIKEIDDKLTVVMLTATKSIVNAAEAIKFGAYDYITKPFEAGHIQLAVRKALERRSLLKEIASLRLELEKKKTAK